MQPTYENIKNAYKGKGFTFYSDTKPFNINLWGIRKQIGRVDVFDDLLGLSCKDENGEILHIFHTATVDPGLYYLQSELINPNGIFILKPGQYKACWEKGFHKGKYIALVQKKGYTGFRGWRDKTMNGLIERTLDANGNYFSDVIGLNMHRSSLSFSEVVGKFSAGCQVRKINDEHKEIMKIIDKAINIYGNSFTYTLFDEEDIFPASKSFKSKQKMWPVDYIKVQTKSKK